MSLPTFIIIGERRCGTTTLYHILKDHPEVFIYSKSDYNYFIESEITDTRIYKDGRADCALWEQTHSIEQYKSLFDGGENFKVSGHKGPDLFFWQPAHERLKRYTPQSKFILTLRNPVGRAWSHYWNEVGKGRESLSFEKAIEAENERIAKSDYALDHLSYIKRGFYDESLKKFLAVFPREQILILILEDFYSNPTSFYSSICDFLGISAQVYEEEESTTKNQNFTMIKKDWVGEKGFFAMLDKNWLRITDAIIVRLTKSQEKRRKWRGIYNSLFRRPASDLKMDEKTRDYLSNLYLPHIKNLEAILGRNLGIWYNK